MNNTNTNTNSLSSAAWFHAHHDLPSVFASPDAVSVALDEYPGNRSIGDDVRDFADHGIYSRHVRMCIDGVSSDTPEPHAIDREPGTPEELYAWLSGFVMTEEARAITDEVNW